MTKTTPTELLRQAREALAYLLPLAEMQPADVERGRHLMQGDCPDETQPSSRDAECPACKKMVAAAELIAAIDALPSAPAWPCHCDERGIGKPGVTCGDCPRDYGHTVDSAPSGEPAEFDHDIGADRFKVVKGPFWWHIRIGDSTGNVGKFHSKLAAEDVALNMLTAFRDGAYMQYHAMRAAPQAAPAPQAAKASTAAAAPEPVASGYITRVRAQVEEQRRVFPSEEPDYLWRYTHGTRDAEHFEGCADLEVVRLYTRPTPTVAATVRGLTEAEMLECVRSIGTPAPMGLTRDRGPYEVTEPTWFLTRLVRAIEAAHGIATPAAPKE